MKHRASQMVTAATFAIAAMTMAACGIYDDQDDCQLDLQLRLKYDYNMLFADAFAHEVKTARVYAYDPSGALAMSKTIDTSDGKQTIDASELATDVDYDFLVWAEGEDHGDSYDFGSASQETSASAKLLRDGDNAIASDITPLFHGRLTSQKFEKKYNTTQTIEIPLVKDTKNIKVVLQEIDGEGSISPNDFTMTITDNNGYLDYDNSLKADDQLTYYPWSTYNGEAGVDEGDTKVAALVAEFSINRLVKESHSPRLTVKNNVGETVLSIPLIDYALLVKGNYNSSMSDQEYLDRQDSYDLVFFISQGRWLNSVIYINSWRVVLQGADI